MFKDAAIFVDVRDGDEYDTSRIENAMNISWGFANLVRGTEARTDLTLPLGYSSSFQLSFFSRQSTETL